MKRIKLTKGKYALVSDKDYWHTKRFKWYASQESKGGKKWYAVRWVTVRTAEPFTMENGWVIYKTVSRKKKIRMHHYILGINSSDLPKGYVVDHKDDDGLNNQRSNLKVITQRANMLKCPGWKRCKQQPQGKKKNSSSTESSLTKTSP